MYRIATEYFRYDNRDAVVGTSRHVLPNTYETQALAAYFANVHTEASFGDEGYFVMDAVTGERVCKPVPQVVTGEDIPF